MEAITASVEITPSRLLPTACHGPFDTPSKAVMVPFEANILALRENGHALAIISLDWFYASPGLRQRILDRCAGRLDDRSLFVAASHAHTSPATDPTKVGFSAVDEAYVTSVENNIANRVNEMLRLSDWRPARLRFTTTTCDCCINRRRLIWRPKGLRLQRIVFTHPNPAAARDRELRLLRVEDEGGRLLSVIWGISCHPTEWPQIRELSSDYPGVVRQALRERLGRDLPVLFLQGFCGDLRPPATGRWVRTGPWKRRLLVLCSSLLNGPDFIRFTSEEYRTWVEGISTCARRAADEAANVPPLITTLVSHRTSVALSALGLSGETCSLTCHWFDLAEGLKFVGLSAEPCWEYIHLVKRIFPGKTIWPVGYIDSVFGYLPTQSMLSEGGYEVTGFRRPFGIKGEFVPDLEHAVAELISS
jgi:neutral ceramidase